MSIADVAIRRHVLTVALALTLMLMGIVAYRGLALDRMPKIDLPILTVVTALEGADPDTVAKSVTTPLEAQLNTVPGVETLTSVSGQGTSQITISFAYGTDMKDALADVQSKVERAKRGLPDEADTPVIMKMDINAEPVLQLMLTADKPMEGMALTRAAVSLQKRLQSLSGVGEVQLSGVAEEVLRVTLDPALMRAYGLTVPEVQQALAQNQVQPAAGKARLPGKDMAVKLDFESKTSADLALIQVGTYEGRPVRVTDIGEVSATVSKTKQIARFNGKPGVAIQVSKTNDGNPLELVRRIEEKLPDLRKSLPTGMSIVIASEEASPIQELVDALGEHLVEGTLLTALVIWAFLKSLRATIIVSVAIPVSLLGALAAFQFFGYTLNSFTLLALLLLIGIVVDDAIVVLENIYRVQESNGLRGAAAATQGAREVLFSVAAATLTLVAIFGPVMYLGGVMGQLFLPFAAVVTIGVLVSWFVAVTLTPMLCAKLLQHEEHTDVVAAWLERTFRRMEAGYANALVWSMNHRRVIMIGSALTLLPAAGMFMSLEKGFMPTQATGRLSVRVELPPGLPTDEADRQLHRVESVLQAVTYNGTPVLESWVTTFRESGRTGAPYAALTLTLKDEVIPDQAEVILALDKALRPLDGLRATVSASQAGGGGGGLQFSLVGPDMPTVAAASEQLKDLLRANPVTAAMRSNLNQSSPQLTVTVDPQAAAQRGVSRSEIGKAIAGAMGSMTAAYYTGSDGERHAIELQVGDRLTGLDQLRTIPVRGAGGVSYALGDVAVFAWEGAASTITRESQQYAVSFSGPTNGSMGAAVEVIEAAVAKMPSGVYVSYSGQAKEFKTMAKSLGLVFLSSLVLLYLVMASQFNDYKQPGLLMLAQPLAAIGGLGALWLTGNSLNIYSMVGLVLLLGLTAKTGILLVDRANQLQGPGVSPREAMLLAAPQRLRPILMTALTVIASLFPAALGLGAGAENNGPLATAVIGGMISATVLTLFVIPVGYIGMSRSNRAIPQ